MMFSWTDNAFWWHTMFKTPQTCTKCLATRCAELWHYHSNQSGALAVQELVAGKTDKQWTEGLWKRVTRHSQKSSVGQCRSLQMNDSALLSCKENGPKWVFVTLALCGEWLIHHARVLSWYLIQSWWNQSWAGSSPTWRFPARTLQQAKPLFGKWYEKEEGRYGRWRSMFEVKSLLTSSHPY